MPTYEYECPLCGHFEVEQKITENSLDSKPGCTEKKCPHKAERVISATAFHLKGGGWYKTDYSSSGSGGGSSKTKTTKEEASSSSDSSSSEKKTESDSGSALKTAGKCGSKCGCH